MSHQTPLSVWKLTVITATSWSPSFTSPKSAIIQVSAWYSETTKLLNQFSKSFISNIQYMQISGGMLSTVVTAEWHYGPCRLRVNNLTTNNLQTACIYLITTTTTAAAATLYLISLFCSELEKGEWPPTGWRYQQLGSIRGYATGGGAYHSVSVY